MAVIDGTPNGDFLNGGEDDDTIRGFDGNDILNGLGGDDHLIGGAGADILNGQGSGGTPTVNGDILEGGEGDDTYTLNSALDQIIESSGDDLVIMSFASYNIDIGIERLRIDTAGNFNGRGNGLDNIFTRDVSAVDSGSSEIRGGGGNDDIEGSNLVDLLIGQDGDDTLIGLEGDDLLIGGAGNDSFDIRSNLVSGPVVSGADRMIGGTGDDLFHIDTAADEIVELFNEGTDTVRIGGQGVNFDFAPTFIIPRNVENIEYNGRGIDTFLGSSADNVISVRDVATNVNLVKAGGGDDTIVALTDVLVLNGQSGDDTLIGSSGNNQLIGGTGDDTLDGGQGNDTMFGGFGSDTFLVDAALDSVREAGVDIDHVRATISSFTLAARLENLTFDITDPNIDATGKGNGLVNSITGGAGDDKLFGGGGGDTLIGSGGNDVLLGQGGDDRLEGGAGFNVLRGHTGADTFVVAAGADTDRVLDYIDGADKIDLTALNFAQFEDFSGLISASGGTTLINFASGERLELVGVAAAALDATDFILSA